MPWEQLLTADKLTIGTIIITVVTSILGGALIPSVHHKWAIEVLSKDRDEWRRHAESLERGVERLADLMDLRRRT